jgi:UrcA family protein
LLLFLGISSIRGGDKSAFSTLKRSNHLTHLAPRTAGLALALIALPLTAANAQPSVRIGDLNLASATGQAAFAHRLNVAADQACGNERNFSIQYACKAAVRAEVTEKLAAITPATEFAALPAAHAHPSVRFADLNLASVAGKATFAHRLNVAAAEACGNEKNLSIAYACKAAVRAEVTEKLAMINPVTHLAAR